jgi:hypothetical protein
MPDHTIPRVMEEVDHRTNLMNNYFLGQVSPLKFEMLLKARPPSLLERDIKVRPLTK